MNDYLKHLRELVKRKSVFTEPKDVEHAMQYCVEVFERNLKNHKIYRDTGRNLIAIHEGIDVSKDIVYLSAHVDTVDAKAGLWSEPYAPFEPYEDEKEIVARGVNDCKAGVALILWMSEMDLGAQVIYTVTFKEEGPGEKTALEVGRELGKSLPVSEKDTYFLVFENNVRVKKKPVLCVYASERSNYAVEVDGTLSEIQEWLRELPNFNPVSCFPKVESEDIEWKIHEQQGGHICSVPREENLLMELIMEAEATDLIKAGKSGNFSVVPAEILMGRGTEERVHTLVMGNRSFDSIEKVEGDLKILPTHKRLKPFEYACGFNIEEKFKRNKISELLVGNGEIDIELTYNVGGSDGTHVFAVMNSELKERFYPIVMGPGCRSQRNVEPARLTHGKNETFDKRCGEVACKYITGLTKMLLSL